LKRILSPVVIISDILQLTYKNMSLDTHDKKYIHNEITSEIRKALDKAFAANNKVIFKEMDRRTGIILDAFRHETKLMAELINTRPSREEMNEQLDEIRSDIRLVRADVNMLQLQMAQ
jgi:hypothetical protein